MLIFKYKPVFSQNVLELVNESSFLKVYICQVYLWNRFELLSKVQNEIESKPIYLLDNIESIKRPIDLKRQRLMSAAITDLKQSTDHFKKYDSFPC